MELVTSFYRLLQVFAYSMQEDCKVHLANFAGGGCVVARSAVARISLQGGTFCKEVAP